MNQPTTGPFADHTLPLAERVADLLGRLTTTEKISLLYQYQAPVPRLGLAAFKTGTEALHGLAWLGEATVFPQAVGLASSWDLDLIRRVGAAVGTEVRGSHRKDPTGAGLNVWAPVVNPLRDPRWGRNEEGYAEDPWLTGEVACAYAGGLRGDHPTLLRTAPTLKHFLGYNNETDRDVTSSQLGPRVLHEYELPAFRAPIAAGAAVAVMLSYNLVNGRPAHVTPLLADELRTWTDDEVLAVSDAAAPSLLAGRQGYHPDHVHGTAAAIRAGLDSFTEIGSDPAMTVERITGALAAGLITEADLDAAVRRILGVRFRLGEFDGEPANPYAAISAEVVNCPAHQDLARAAAAGCVVLLKNDTGLLPLAADRLRRIAVVGPLATEVLTDWYSGTLPYQVSAAAGIAAAAPGAAVVTAAGVDRIALREAATGRYLAVGADGGPELRLLAAAPGGAPAAAGFDMLDWGQGVFSLRAAATGRTVSVDDTGLLVADKAGPGGWVVRETFQLVNLDGGAVALRHRATGLDVVAGPDGRLHLAETSPAGSAGSTSPAGPNGPNGPAEPGAAGGTAIGGSATAIVGGAAGHTAAFVAELVVDGIAAAAAAAAAADVAVVLVGNHPMVNGRETEDRADLELPAAQEALLRAVHAANPATVLALTSSYPYAITWADQHLPAVLWSAHGGQEFGTGLAAVLFGACDPGGRLTQTWYRSVADLPDLLDYDIISTDSTYLYHRGRPLYPFGHGLSYTTFGHSDLVLATGQPAGPGGAVVDADGTVTATVTVTNTGTRPGVEVVQLYGRQRTGTLKRPLRQLLGFQRVSLAPGEQAVVNISFPVSALAAWDVTRSRPVVEPAAHQIMIGRSAHDIVLAAGLTVRGEPIPPRAALSGRLRAVDHDGYADTSLVPEEVARGDAVEATAPGGWVAFLRTDFGAGAATGTLRVRWVARRGTGAEAPTLTIRLGNPVDGPVAGTTVVPDTGDRFGWVDVPVALAGAAGVQDLYVVFSAAGIGLSSLAFEAVR